jgi:hypothetical protein
VRPCDTSKQCLWLGTSQYCHSCRNACANPNCFADSCVECYAVRCVNANAYCDCDSYNTTIAVAYALFTGIAYAYDTTITDAYSYGNRFTDAYTGAAQGNA